MNLRLLLFPLCLFAFTDSLSAQGCLVADYSFDGQANDAVGSFSGTVYGATATSDRFGAQNSALYFNGSSSYVILPSNFDYPQRTISFWFNAQTVGATWTCLFESDHAGTQNAQTEVGVRYYNNDNQISYVVGSVPNRHWQVFSPSTWYHLAVVRDSAEVRYYLNCELVGTYYDMSNLHSTASNFQPNTYLGQSSGSGYFFHGMIDELKVYNCALTPSQVAGLCSWASVPSNEPSLTSCGIANAANLATTDPQAISTLFSAVDPSSGAVITICNMMGQVVYEAAANPAIPQPALPALAPGMYLYRVVCSEGEKHGYIDILKK